ncbi:serine/threonine-protein kinase [Williamsia limnetica]|uniref:non-specific serine/threonine protein kinase n=1 Tax=Williamsia limnetica TaxID=882452 RepID=A0A318S4N0_WILLI|nr:serine/threonine-protein kinase [Williamsia limnetica]PYE19119.1 serine/threonine-protein kinase [Williamsia limnetica]
MVEGSRTGTRFGAYRLDALIGRGGMGEVYRAYDTAKDRTVALKLLNLDLAQDPTYQERFRRESHAAARLQEPHVIPIHDWGEIDGVLYIDMRLVAGQDLRAALREGGAMDPARAVTIVEQVAGALDAAHADGLIHRDVKPENIILAEGDFAYLVDFGIAHSGDDSQLTAAGLAIGSYRYMAPERFDNARLTPMADVYSLTCVLHECLTGSTPYQADTISSAVKAHVLNPAPQPSRVRPGVPTGFDQVIAQGLEKQPEHRYQTAGQLATAARAALTGSSIPAPQTIATGYSGAGFPYAPPTVAGMAPAGAGLQYNPTVYSGPVAPPPTFGTGQQQYFTGPQQGGSGNGSQSKVIIGVLVGLIVLALGGLAALLLWYTGSKDDADGDPAVAVSTVTETAGGQVQNTQAPAPVPAGPPPGSTPCPAVYGQVGTLTGSAIGSAVTSCAFAEEVRISYAGSGAPAQPRQILATSPVTGVTYVMMCTPAGPAVTCTGGENAVVHLF